MMDGSLTNLRWWDAEGRVLASRVLSAVECIKQDDTERQQDCLQNARLYGEHTVFGYEFKSLPRKTRLTMNLIKSVVDSVVARIVKNKPRPVFLTSGGNRSLKRKAKNLTRYVDYAMEAGDAGDAFRDAFLDAAVLGTGFVHVFTVGTKVCYERVFPSEVLVDHQEGLYKQPRTMYRQKWIPRDTLISIFEGKESAIIGAAQPSQASHMGRFSNRCDLVQVYEAWRLPSKPGAKDGKHVIVTDKGVLHEEDWEYDTFSIIPIRYSCPLQGYYGKGIAENLTGIQVELNKNLLKRQKILDLMAVPRIFMKDKGIKSSKLNNMIGGVYTGDAPTVWAPRTLPPELDGYIENLWSKGHALEGISPIESQGSIPAGLNSGVAVREYDSVVDGKFALSHLAYQKAWMIGAEWAVKFGREIHEQNPSWSPVASHDKYTISTVKWEDLDMAKDDYVLRMLASSSLPTNPGARKQEVMDLFQIGLMPLEEARKLLDYPDIEEANSLDRSMSDYLDFIVEKMLDENIPVAPEPFQDPALALKRIQSAYHIAVMDDVPEDRLQLLVDYMAATRDQVKAAQQEQAAMMAPPQPGAPPAIGAEGAPPTALNSNDPLANQ